MGVLQLKGNVMAKKQIYRNDVKLGHVQPVRVLFSPALDEPTQVDGRGDPKYAVTIGFPEDHPDYAELYTLCSEMAEEKWPGIDTDSGLDLKFKSGDEEYEYYANKRDEDKRREYPALKGLVMMKLRSKNPISVFDVRRRDEKGVPVKIADKEEIRNTIYAGCYVALDLTFATYDAIESRDNPDAKPGVTAYPEKICFVNDGERLSAGGKDSGSSFASVQGAITDEDPTGGEG